MINIKSAFFCAIYLVHFTLSFNLQCLPYAQMNTTISLASHGQWRTEQLRKFPHNWPVSIVYIAWVHRMAPLDGMCKVTTQSILSYWFWTRKYKWEVLGHGKFRKTTGARTINGAQMTAISWIMWHIGTTHALTPLKRLSNNGGFLCCNFDL